MDDDDRGKKVKVEVRFTDILGGEETRTSAPTATLAGALNTAATGARRPSRARPRWARR